MPSPTSRSWFASNPRKTGWLIAFVCLAFLEGAVRVLVGLGQLPYQEYPTSREPRYWAYVDPVVGMWRYPHATLHLQEKCLDVQLATNAEGARDPERQQRSASERRFVVLGDSFIEGYGLDAEHRVTNLLEARTGVEFLNFATSGGFGTIQEWLVYQSRALKYDHTDLMLFILPANDFDDNDPGNFAPDVYRPYLRPAGDGYEVYYTVPWERRFMGSRRMSTVIKNTVDNTFYLANAFRWATRELKSRVKKQRLKVYERDYDSYSPEELQIMLDALEKLVDAAGDRRIWLLTIPTDKDFAAGLRGEQSRLPRELASFAARFPNVRYRDLLPDFLGDARVNGRDYPEYLNECDHHWGKLGNRLVADRLQAWLF